MSKIFFCIALLCFNAVQIFLLFRYAQISRDLADCMAFKDAVLAFLQDMANKKLEEDIVD